MADDMPVAKATPLDKLHPAPWNPRLIKDERFQNLCKSIQADPEFLELRPVLAQSDGTIYAGNMRWRAAQHLKHKTIPAIVEDVPDQLARERALRDNAQWGEWVEDEVAELLHELGEAGSALDLLGFDEKELHRLLESVGAGADVSVDELEEKWIVLVECKDEAQQVELLGRFEAEGLQCKAVIG